MSYVPPGLCNVMIFSILVCLLSTVTPILLTSAGSEPVAIDTLFMTFTVAMSGSVP